MKPSELRKLYLSVAHLYGFVHSKELFDILNHYGISYKKEQIYKDLEDRCTKMTQGFYVVKLRKGKYLIIDSLYDHNGYDVLSSQKADKPMYFPKKYDDLLKYSDCFYIDKESENSYNNLFNFLKRHLDCEEVQVKSATLLILLQLKCSLNNGIKDVFNFLDKFKFDKVDEKSLNKLIKILQDANNNMRLPSNNGFTPHELLKISGPIDFNKMGMTLGPNIKNSLLDGTIDAYDFQRNLDLVDLPLIAKASLKKEILEIIDKIEDKFKV